MKELLLHPSVLLGLSELIVAALGLILTVGLPLLSAKFYKLMGARIEEKHMKALHEAVLTWAENATIHGLTPANQAAVGDLQDYLRASVPDAYKALSPSVEVLGKLAGRYLRYNFSEKSPF